MNSINEKEHILYLVAEYLEFYGYQKTLQSIQLQGNHWQSIKHHFEASVSCDKERCEVNKMINVE